MTQPRTRNEDSRTDRPIWKLQPKADRRFRSGHPWVYSNELAGSPKGLEPGSRVELQDASGQFLAWGYGNPHSLISFRQLGRTPQAERLTDVDFLATRLRECFELRHTLGLTEASYRLCFGEADRLPGLVIDRFLLEDGRSQVFVVQPHTAGADRWMAAIPETLERLVREVAPSGADAWSHTRIVERADLAVRKLEGIEPREPRILRDAGGGKLDGARIRVQSAFTRSGFVLFDCDLESGQKTGFFLDQRAGTRMAAEAAQHALRGRKGDSRTPFRILDLCCYVGQWSVTVVSALHALDPEQPLEVVLVDVSTDALQRARANVERLAEGGRSVQVRVVRQDVFDALRGEVLADEAFDLVVADPPALIKGRKDLGPGEHAYLQLNTLAMRKAAPGALYVACSCSALLEEEALIGVLARASSRSRRGVRWFARSFQGPDHPVLAEFPEGRYLKTLLGWVERNS
jgi:23S rRNA (cytosine1962-C5)-methyltransferase